MAGVYRTTVFKHKYLVYPLIYIFKKGNKVSSTEIKKFLKDTQRIRTSGKVERGLEPRPMN